MIWELRWNAKDCDWYWAQPSEPIDSHDVAAYVGMPVAWRMSSLDDWQPGTVDHIETSDLPHVELRGSHPVVADGWMCRLHNVRPAEWLKLAQSAERDA